jgi:formyl-CoA transferase
LSETSLPLAGVRVLEFGTLIAGPFCSRILAEFGAEVIKIEAPGEGDPLRKWRKLYPTEDGDTSLWWFVQARNKQSVTLNLKHPRGVEIALQLAAQADIVVENFRPGVMEKLGLGWDVLSAAESWTGDGAPVGLWSDRPTGEAQAGLWCDRRVHGGPALHHRLSRPAAGKARGYPSAIRSLRIVGCDWRALMALRHREVNGGVGQVVDVALYEAVFAMMESLVPEFDVAGFIRERTGNVMPGITPSNTHTTRDGKHMIIGANGDAIFKRLMLAMWPSGPGRGSDAWPAMRDGTRVRRKSMA